ncbi:hypothetical protein EVAR_36718_1 [Eumeta japonica]|uniref:Uncharacterized protein n=1 Tax=Eumeta variegata TaxID=151549 RepID=A0A4C1XNF9_EUMVA|nr:hypothetical protein EVAR_36718_1 [Eumeta japonica]
MLEWKPILRKLDRERKHTWMAVHFSSPISRRKVLYFHEAHAGTDGLLLEPDKNCRPRDSITAINNNMRAETISKTKYKVSSRFEPGEDIAPFSPISRPLYLYPQRQENVTFLHTYIVLFLFRSHTSFPRVPKKTSLVRDSSLQGTRCDEWRISSPQSQNKHWFTYFIPQSSLELSIFRCGNISPPFKYDVTARDKPGEGISGNASTLLGQRQGFNSNTYEVQEIKNNPSHRESPKDRVGVAEIPPDAVGVALVQH